MGNVNFILSWLVKNKQEKQSSPMPGQLAIGPMGLTHKVLVVLTAKIIKLRIIVNKIMAD